MTSVCISSFLLILLASGSISFGQSKGSSKPKTFHIQSDIADENLEDVVSSDDVQPKKTENSRSTPEPEGTNPPPLSNPEPPNIETDRITMKEKADSNTPMIDMMWFVDPHQGDGPKEQVKNNIQKIMKELKGHASLKIGVLSSGLYDRSEENRINKYLSEHYNTGFYQYDINWPPEQHTRALEFAINWIENGDTKEGDKSVTFHSFSRYGKDENPNSNYHFIFVFSTTEDSKKYPPPKKGLFSSMIIAFVVVGLTGGLGAVSMASLSGAAAAVTVLGAGAGGGLLRAAWESERRERAHRKHEEILSKDKYQPHKNKEDFQELVIGASKDIKKGDFSGIFQPKGDSEKMRYQKAVEDGSEEGIPGIKVWSFVVGGDDNGDTNDCTNSSNPLKEGQILTRYARKYRIDKIYKHNDSFKIMDNYLYKNGLCFSSSQKIINTPLKLHRHVNRLRQDSKSIYFSFNIQAMERGIPIPYNRMLYSSKPKCNILCENDPLKFYEYYKRHPAAQRDSKIREFIKQFEEERGNYNGDYNDIPKRCEIHSNRDRETSIPYNFVTMLQYGDKKYFQHLPPGDKRDYASYIHMQMSSEMNGFCSNFRGKLEDSLSKIDLPKSSYTQIKGIFDSAYNLDNVNLSGKCIKVCDITEYKSYQNCNVRRVGHEYLKMTKLFGGINAHVCKSRDEKIDKFINDVKEENSAVSDWIAADYKFKKEPVPENPIQSIELIKEISPGNLKTIYVANAKKNACVIQTINEFGVKSNGKVDIDRPPSDFEELGCKSKGESYRESFADLGGPGKDSKNGSYIEIKYKTKY